MDKILLFNVDIFKTNVLINLISPLGYEVISVSKQQQGNTIGNLFSKNIKSNSFRTPFDDSMMVIYTQNEKRVDLLLDLLRNHKIMIDYKAVATKHNVNWSAIKLFEQLQEETRRNFIHG